jgi:phosphate transport system substrate-binding protein
MTVRSCLCVAAGLLALAAAAPAVDEKLPEYRSAEGVTGTIKSVGSDTMVNLMTHWGDGFKKYYPGISFEVEGKGSATAPVALAAGQATFGPMSRAMKSQEIDAFEKAKGFKPVPLATSIDMLAIFVHKDNPLTSLTLPQLDAVFSKGRKAGHEKDVRTWGDLGLTGEWAGKPISLYGRNAASGTYGFLKEAVLKNGDYKDTVKEQPGSSAVVQGVASDRFGIGYSGIGYRTADVKVLALARAEGGTPVEATPENAYTGKYPLARFLYLYVSHDPAAQLDPLRAEFLRYVFSKQGQQDVIKDGFLPVPAAVATRNLKSVGLAK